MTTEYSVQVPINLIHKTNYWIAFCPALKTFGYSKTSSDEALKDFENALKTFFHFQDKLGKLDETLRNLGWQRVGSPNVGAPQIPIYFPEKRYRAQSATTVEREILVPA